MKYCCFFLVKCLSFVTIFVQLVSQGVTDVHTSSVPVRVKTPKIRPSDAFVVYLALA